MLNWPASVAPSAWATASSVAGFSRELAIGDPGVSRDRVARRAQRERAAFASQRQRSLQREDQLLDAGRRRIAALIVVRSGQRSRRPGRDVDHVDGPVVDPVLDIGPLRPYGDPLGDRLRAPPPVVGDKHHSAAVQHGLDLVRSRRGEAFEVDTGLEVPGGVPQLRDLVHQLRILGQQRRRHVDIQLVGDHVRRHHRGRGEQLGVVDDAAVRDERDAGLLLPRHALDVGDVDVAGLGGGVEGRETARIGPPRSAPGRRRSPACRRSRRRCRRSGSRAPTAHRRLPRRFRSRGRRRPVRQGP